MRLERLRVFYRSRVMVATSEVFQPFRTQHSEPPPDRAAELQASQRSHDPA